MKWAIEQAKITEIKRKPMHGRKFYYGDEIIITGKRYENHIGHHGIVVWTHLSQSTVYEVECECNDLLKLRSHMMELVKERAVTEVISIADRQKRMFVRRFKLIPDKKNIDQQIDKFLSVLSDRYKQIIIDRFGLGSDGVIKTQIEIGANLGVSKQRIEQIERAAINKIKDKVLA